MIKAVLGPGLAIATIFAGAIYLAATLADATAGSAQPVVKDNPVDAPAPTTPCTQHVWPYYETACLRDRGRPGERASQARVVSLDGLAGRAADGSRSSR